MLNFLTQPTGDKIYATQIYSNFTPAPKTLLKKKEGKKKKGTIQPWWWPGMDEAIFKSHYLIFYCFNPVFTVCDSSDG